MRVVTTATYRNFASSVNDVHERLNKSMNKISSGKAYESAADNPLAYYEGKKIDSQYLDTVGKLELITDVKNRLYQQELGVRDIQENLSYAKKAVLYIQSETNNSDMSTVDTKKNELLSYQQTMVNDLNAQYQNFYIFGGNDISTAPFTLSADGSTLTFTHQFTGDDKATTIEMKLEDQGDGTYAYSFSGTDSKGNTLDKDASLTALSKAMMEQGRMDLGYGTIYEKDTLIDTYTGGLNAITGLSSDALKAMDENKRVAEIEKALNNSAIALTGKAALTLNDYSQGGDKSVFSSSLGTIMTNMEETIHTVGTVYSDLGTKYSILESTEERLTLNKQTLTEQYTEKLGADSYESILEMYSYNQSYNAALSVSSYLMNMSLFDFMS